MVGIDILSAVRPVIVLLALGIAAAMASRALRLSPVVGYLLLGMALKAAGKVAIIDSGTIAILAQLGVVFLLFDIGLHFSLAHVREQAGDIFGFGPIQVLFGTLGLAAAGWLYGLPPASALLLGAVLALSSTAVVARIIAERHQQNCPVGLTATAILIFQDVAAIFLLIIAGGTATAPADMLRSAGLALLKAAGSFGVAVLLARLVVRPVFALVARGGNEEVFTALALLIALAAGWATGEIGLSLTLGAFLGGMIVAETSFRSIVQSEIKPFRGLLLGFFFIAVGLSLDVWSLLRLWPAVIGVAAVIVAIKSVTNAAASLVFRWSVPGSIQLGFLLAQGSEFAFVVLGLPTVRAALGAVRISVVVAAVALTLAATPGLAVAGRSLAGTLRMRRQRVADPELQPRESVEPVLILGMNAVGRTVADALNEFGIGYSALEHEPRRLREALADGYPVAFGDIGDARIWEPVALGERRVSVWSSPDFETAREIIAASEARYPGLRRFVAVDDEGDAARFQALGLTPVATRGVPAGLDLAEAVLASLAADPNLVAGWRARQQQRVLGTAGNALTAA